MTQSRIGQIRKIQLEDLPRTTAYLHQIGEPLDTRKQHQKGRKKKSATSEGSDGVITLKEDQTGTPKIQSSPADSPDVPLRPLEKKRLNFEGKLYLAPLTTVGNLPFRRLCVGYGADITIGEMGLAQEFLSGNKNEWSLVKRHPSERFFGVQLCGNRPQTLVAATEHLKRETQDIDFIDVNSGCPIDLVVKKGAGSALLDQGGKLSKILRGMNIAAGETPVTIKMRTGLKTGHNTTHKLMSRAIREWGVGALTVRRLQLRNSTRTTKYCYLRRYMVVLNSNATLGWLTMITSKPAWRN